jgi:hypothetical protein
MDEKQKEGGIKIKFRIEDLWGVKCGQLVAGAP